MHLDGLVKVTELVRSMGVAKCWFYVALGFHGLLPVGYLGGTRGPIIGKRGGDEFMNHQGGGEKGLVRPPSFLRPWHESQFPALLLQAHPMSKNESHQHDSPSMLGYAQLIHTMLDHVLPQKSVWVGFDDDADMLPSHAYGLINCYRSADGCFIALSRTDQWIKTLAHELGHAYWHEYHPIQVQAPLPVFFQSEEVEIILEELANRLQEAVMFNWGNRLSLCLFQGLEWCSDITDVNKWAQYAWVDQTAWRYGGPRAFWMTMLQLSSTLIRLGSLGGTTEANRDDLRELVVSEFLGSLGANQMEPNRMRAVYQQLLVWAEDIHHEVTEFVRDTIQAGVGPIDGGKLGSPTRLYQSMLHLFNHFLDFGRVIAHVFLPPAVSNELKKGYFELLPDADPPRMVFRQHFDAGGYF